ncbi:hypothetical protein AMTRI_Chr10g226540 [Amborella trichopoda]
MPRVISIVCLHLHLYKIIWVYMECVTGLKQVTSTSMSSSERVGWCNSKVKDKKFCSTVQLNRTVL